jgi:TP901 family phage tail tape measure protein
MANPNISVDVSGNTAKLQQQINQVARRPLVVDVRTGGAGAAQPLGKLSGQIGEIDKSLAAANARVIAFGAAAGTIFALQNAVTSLFKTFVDTEKKLQDINVLLNLTDKNLASFGNSLFDIAGNTAQSFDVVAEAATELSRQGLGVEETLKRTEAALILTRLSGLDAAASVSALTAAINSFQSSTLEATEIVNKLANVDAAFAVSSADLANALSRVGSSADDAGISFDELIALVTTAQQITARGGSVIGNSLKTIFTRLGRGKVQEVLGGLGISATDEQGQVKNQVQLLKELAAVYDTLSSTQKNYVAEQVGGVFQINILKAALGDLGKEYSIYDRALKTSLSTTDEAIQRNEQLNQTLSALGSQTLANVQKAASSIGEGLFGDASRNVLNVTNFLAEGVSNADAESIGGQIGKGVIDGLSKFISGPGLALATGVIVKLLADFGRYGAEAFQSILGTNTAAKEQAVVQQNITKFLQNNSSLYNSILNGQVSVSSAAEEYLAVIQSQTAALQKQNAVAASISKNLAGSVGIATIGEKQFVATKNKGKTAAGGYFPEAIEQANINARIGGANPATDRPVTIPNFAFGGGKRGSITAHTGEWAIPNFAGSGGTAIFNKDMKKKYGLPDGARKIFASGFIPNFAQNIGRGYSVLDGDSLLIDKDYPDVRLQGKEMRLESVDAIESWQKYGQKGSPNAKSLARSIINKEFPNLDSALKSSGKTGKAAYDRPYFNSTKLQNALIQKGLGVPDLRYGSTLKGLTMGVMNAGIGLWSDKNKDGFYNHPKAQQFIKQNNLEKKLSSRTDISNNKKNFILGSATRFGTGRYGGELLRDIIPSKGKPGSKNYKPERGYNYQSLELASGFIPNFAQTKKAIDLGNLDTIPNKLGNKVVSLIYPGLSDGYSLRPATANYLKQDYRGNIPVAGINQKTLRSQIPDLDKNLGNLLVREANQFGQSLGGTNFLKSAEDLPNFGAAKGAVGVAFEGGVQTLLQQKVGRKQNAGIDFRNITPRLRSIFNGAPGMYDAKSSPDLTNEVLKKLLNETRPGAIVQKSSGQAGKDYAAKRSAAVNQLRQEARDKNMPEPTGVKMRQLLREKFGIVGKAAGYIPNFANTNTNKGIPVSKIRAHFDKSGNPIAVTNTMHEPNGLKDAIGREKRGIGLPAPKTSSSGFIPNFAIDDEISESESAISSFAKSFGAVALQIALFAGISQMQNKDSRADLTKIRSINKEKNSIERKALADQIKAERSKASATPLRDASGRFAPKDKAAIQSRAASTRSQFAEQSAQQRSAVKPGIVQRGLSSASAGKFTPGIGTSFIAPIIAETISNGIPQETKTGRVGATAVSGVGTAASFAGIGGLVGGGPGAIIGGVIGSFVGLKQTIDQLNTSLPEFQAATSKSTENLARVNDNTQNLLTSYEQYTSFLESGSANQENIDKAQKNFTEFLNKFDPKDAEKIINALETGGKEGFRTEVNRVGEAAATDEATKKAAQKFQGAFEKISFTNVRPYFSAMDPAMGGPPGAFSAEPLIPGGQVSEEGAKVFEEAIVEQARLSKENINDRLSRLGGIGNINTDAFLKDFLAPITDEKNINEILKSNNAKEAFIKIIKDAISGLEDGAKQGETAAKALGAAAGKGVVATFAKEVISGLIGKIDSILSYKPKTSQLGQLQDQFFDGDISRDEFIAKRSLERINVARQLGATPEEIATNFAGDLQNVTNQIGNNLAQEAFDLGLGTKFQGRARGIATSVSAEASGVNKVDPNKITEILAAEYRPDMRFSGDIGGLVSDLQSLINVGALSLDDATNIASTISDKFSVDLATPTSAALSNLQLAESASNSILLSFEQASSIAADIANTFSNISLPQNVPQADQPRPKPAGAVTVPVTNDSTPLNFNISTPNISITAGSNEQILSQVETKLNDAKLRILDDVNFQLQQIRDRNSLNR